MAYARAHGSKTASKGVYIGQCDNADGRFVAVLYLVDARLAIPISSLYGCYKGNG
jgi:hypothetical protein